MTSIKIPNFSEFQYREALIHFIKFYVQKYTDVSENIYEKSLEELH